MSLEQVLVEHLLLKHCFVHLLTLEVLEGAITNPHHLHLLEVHHHLGAGVHLLLQLLKLLRLLVGQGEGDQVLEGYWVVEAGNQLFLGNLP